MSLKQRGGYRRRRMPWAGWSAEEPRGHQRTIMKRDCGRKCFLGPRKSFPICRKYTCDISDKGLWAAYIRAREWDGPKGEYRGKARPRHRRGVYTRIARRSREMLRRRGYNPGWHTRGGGRWHHRKRCPYGTRKRLVGQRRSRTGRITRHGHYACVRTRRR